MEQQIAHVGSSDLGATNAGRMNPEVKARWVAALRSGEYKQVQSALRKTDGMCCLGVLCDLYDPSKWEARGLYRFAYGPEGQTGMPPQEVMQWAGFPTLRSTDSLRKSPQVTIGGKTLGVDDHNDDGRTFAEIADAIEAQL